MKPGAEYDNWSGVREETQAALKQVEENADDDWKALAYQAVVRTAEAMRKGVAA